MDFIANVELFHGIEDYLQDPLPPNKIVHLEILVIGVVCNGDYKYCGLVRQVLIGRDVR